MDFIAPILAVCVAAFIALILPIWLWISQNDLRKTVSRLREEVERLKAADIVRDRPSADPALPASSAPNPWTASGTTGSDSGPVTTPAQEAPAADISDSPPPEEPDAPPKSYVFGPENIARLTTWVKENWFIAIAALSLAMAGIFLVQYGIESGILFPRNRVFCSLAFGGGLIAFGEWVRRRTGDGAEDTTAFLPSAFAGAGIVTLFSGIVAARQLYGLIGPEMAFGGLLAVAALALLLGWVYGPFLTIVGIIGAVATPFIVGGDSDTVAWLFYYFALVAALGLGVDAMKRSAWVSTVGIVVPYIGATLLWLATGSEHFLAFAALVAIASVIVPTRSLRPAYEGAMTFHPFHALGDKGWPEFPTRLAAAAILALAAVAVFVSMGTEVPFYLSLSVLALALAGIAFWLDRSDVLEDLAVPVAVAMLAAIGLQGFLGLPVADAFAPISPDENGTVPRTMTWLTAFGLIISAMAGWRSLRGGSFNLFWAAGAAVFAPATIILLALFWYPLSQMSNIAWAAHVMAVAALMTILAERALRYEGTAHLLTSVYALAALNMIAFAMSIVLTETALTLGFAAIVVSSAWLDRKFDIAPVSWFAQLGVVACGFRLIANPGILWALETSSLELCIGFIGTILLLGVAWSLFHYRERVAAMIVTESAMWSLGGVFVCLLLYRALDDGRTDTHWALSLFGMIWLIAAAAQFHRAQIDGLLQKVRLGLGAAFSALGLLLLALSMTVANPLFGDEVIGPPLIDSLMIAYLLPALLLGAAAWNLRGFDGRLRIAMIAGAALSATLYAGLEIRRIWRGSDISLPGITDGELYTYTIAMLLSGAATLLLALLKKSAVLHKVAIAIIGLTIAKVFLIDMSGLEGLTRVLSFLALGLALAGLALLNRWIVQTLRDE